MHARGHASQSYVLGVAHTKVWPKFCDNALAQGPKLSVTVGLVSPTNFVPLTIGPTKSLKTPHLVNTIYIQCHTDLSYSARDRDCGSHSWTGLFKFFLALVTLCVNIFCIYPAHFKFNFVLYIICQFSHIMCVSGLKYVIFITCHCYYITCIYTVAVLQLFEGLKMILDYTKVMTLSLLIGAELQNTYMYRIVNYMTLISVNTDK